MGLREAARPRVTLSSSRMRRNAPGLCPHTTTGRCVQQSAVRHRYHASAYHQANRLDECGTYIILVLPPSLRKEPAGKPTPPANASLNRTPDSCWRSAARMPHLLQGLTCRLAFAAAASYRRVGPTSVQHTRSLRFSRLSEHVSAVACANRVAKAQFLPHVFHGIVGTGPHLRSGIGSRHGTSAPRRGSRVTLQHRSLQAPAQAPVHVAWRHTVPCGGMVRHIYHERCGPYIST